MKRPIWTIPAWSRARQWDDLQPISSEIFGAEKLRQHALSLAASQPVTKHPPGVYSIINRLTDNAIALSNADSELSKANDLGLAVTPAAEWLIDNYHFVEEQVRQTRADLPVGFYRQLPKLAAGPLAGHPRIFGVVWAYVAHTDSLFEPQSLSDFVNAYQEVQVLTIGELWAVAISLRLILIENLRRVSQRIVESRQERARADVLADVLLATEHDEAGSADAFKKLQQTNITQPFVVQFILRMRDQDALSPQILKWLSTRTTALGYTPEVAVNEEHLRQSTANVTVRNIITSLRLVSDVNWENWFDGASHVDANLRTMPVYTEMDFASRTMYCRAIELLARGSQYSEIEIARLATAAASKSGLDTATDTSDVGFYLIGRGRPAFEKDLNFSPSWGVRLKRSLRSAGLAGYLGSLMALTLAFLAFAAFLTLGSGAAITANILVLVLAIIPASDVAVSITNFIVTRILDAAVLPGLTLRNGVPANLRTLVVVPALITSVEEIEELVDRLEIHFLSSGDGELYFALLTDWPDAITEHADADERLLAAATNGVAQLNVRHGTDRFLLLHRKRLWNPQQGKWMGWERKRGKLHELNRLLRGALDTSFSAVGGHLPDAIKFVITLDADTRLPRDAARRLVGKMAHPLNVAKFDPSSQRVTQGYGVMQPRVTPSLPVGHRSSAFQKIFSAARGMDPYVFAVSDVYQDLFGEGSFAGKGIYDVDAFEAALQNRIPENTMLSHDLFEGNFARSALVTDVEVVEEFPERYSVAVAREHRWVRGDWQLLPWITKRYSPTLPIPPLGQWKIIDNLRRSLSSPMTLLSLFAGWAFLPVGTAAVWTALLVLYSIVPPLLPALTAVLPRKPTITMDSHVKSVAGDVLQTLAVSCLRLVFLAHQSSVMLDAIVRTLYRLLISHKNMLEWTTAAQAHANSKIGLAAYYQLMLSSVAFGMVALAMSTLGGGSLASFVLPFVIAWLAAPAIARQISLSPLEQDEFKASPQDRLHLRLVARRTWRYFDNFVTPAESSLPPDNFQETPNPVVAHRTSPTNIGLYLLSVASAHDFGWIGLVDALTRIEMTMASLKKLEKFRGHLYNWYETTSLRTLEPKYVSTVDSGNLAGHLIAVSNCLTQWLQSPYEGSSQYTEGLSDVLGIIEEDLAKISLESASLKSVRKQLSAELTLFRVLMDKTGVPAVRLIELTVQAAKIITLAQRLSTESHSPATENLLAWTRALRTTVESHLASIETREGLSPTIIKRIISLNADIRELALCMDFGFLQDPRRLLFSIGYRVPESMRDESCYDMLASESRLASFFAIAKGDLRTRHWFRLGRTVTAVRGRAALVSWSGSMFEYLMPSLVMRAPGGGLLDQTMHLVVTRQIDYAKGFGIPWGISESAFNARDIEFTYQYSNFGVPGLGLKRGLANNRVVTPYATGLAAMVAPHEAARNFESLSRMGAAGDFGFYEALDFTPSRLRRGQEVAVIRAFFAHHQGMMIVALLNAVKDGVMSNRFHQEPMIKASELLLQERAPREVPLEQKRLETATTSKNVTAGAAPTSRHFEGLSDAAPATHVLSNGRYSVMLSAAGSGYSNWNGLAVTRWREDGVCDDWGAFAYLRERKTGKVWSAGYMPVATTPDSYSVNFSEDKAEFNRRDGFISTKLECVVSAEDDTEARRITLTNTGVTSRDIEFTSYAELVLGSAAADSAHPAFSKMFVTTEFVPELETLIATRRKRSPEEPDMWVGQFMMVKGRLAGELEIETDRARFLGVCCNTRAPAALASEERLSGTVGAVLDPVFVMRRRLRIPPGRQISCTVWTVVAATRQGVIDLVDRHRQEAAYDRAVTLAWTQGQIQLRHLSIGIEDANLYQTLASHLIYGNAALRPTSKFLIQNAKAQSALWQASISGDRPIMLVRIDESHDIAMVSQLLNAFVYWKTKRIAVDLVILNDRMSSYVQDLQSEIEALVRKINLSKTNGIVDGLGEVYTLRADLLSAETLGALPAMARAVLYARRGSLAAQLARLTEIGLVKPVGKLQPQAISIPAQTPPPAAHDLEYANGFGGFSDDGKEYVINLSRDRTPPAPWINVIANPAFGFQAAADGGGYSWFGNSRENKLTSWSNDPVRNAPSEAIYVQDEVDGDILSPTYAPMKSAEGTHRVRHSFGYTVFERDTRKLAMELLQLVPLAGSVKISRLKITNKSNRTTKLAVTHYAEWVMGLERSSTALYLISGVDEKTGALTMRNPWNLSSGGQVGFVDMGGHQTSWSGDRREFLGSYGSLVAPQALLRGAPLSNRTGAGLDPCSVLQTRLRIEPGASVDLTILLGAASSIEQAQDLIAQYRTQPANGVLAEVRSHWKDTLQQTQVKTPVRSLDIMLNGWLLYQTIACRMWARSGFYQASGAFGFRDQLQDSMALLTARPELARAHILEAAGRQFVEGDFQHWWLPANGAGVRTRIVDDVVWLANCVQHYVKVTGDSGILDETLAFIEGQALRPAENDAFFQPTVSEKSASLYEHCALALDRSLAQGPHGLPLFGTGDWNDGMNRVGEAGQGESIWLGWFLFATLQDFLPIAERRGDANHVADWRERTKTLQVALEQHGWDGQWYRRGYYDDGTPLGSALSDECQIDSIAQSWAVMSGAASVARASQAMEQSYARLAGQSDQVVRLFTPPFDKSAQEPGYIKAYPPGIRENGGQYTHGVIWSIFAHAKLQQPQRALELFNRLNPINHAADEAAAKNYRVEPYVIAADIYAVAPHVGRGGWTWYTGSAGWMQRAGLEAILGITREGNMLHVKPCVPEDWTGFEISTQFGATRYQISLSRSATLQHDPAVQVQTLSSTEFLVFLVDTGGTQNIRLPLLGPVDHKRDNAVELADTA